MSAFKSFAPSRRQGVKKKNKAFDELKRVYESVDPFDSIIDSKERGHVPYVTVLMRALRKWNDARGDNRSPKTYGKKEEFQTLIKSMSWDYGQRNQFSGGLQSRSFGLDGMWIVRQEPFGIGQVQQGGIVRNGDRYRYGNRIVRQQRFVTTSKQQKPLEWVDWIQYKISIRIRNKDINLNNQLN